MLARLILGGVALAATGYGVKKMIDNDDDLYDKMNRTFENTANKMDDMGREVEYFFDDMSQKIDDKIIKDKEANQSSVEEYDEIYTAFYDRVVPYFLETFGSIQNLPDFDMDRFYQLQSKADNDELSNIGEECEDELKAYNKKFAKGVYAVLEESKAIRKLTNIEPISSEETERKIHILGSGGKTAKELGIQDKCTKVIDAFLHVEPDTKEELGGNTDFSKYSRTNQGRIEDIYKLMDDLISVYYMQVLNNNGELSDSFKEKLESIETLADEKI